MTQDELNQTISDICTWLNQSFKEDMKRIEQIIPADEAAVGMANARASTIESLALLLEQWLQIPT